MDAHERDEKLRAAVKERMEAPFDAFRPPEKQRSAEDRKADALEYIAYQLGEIRRLISEKK